jgi:hypothetical protein
MTRRAFFVACLALLAFGSGRLEGQALPVDQPVILAVPPANPVDVASIDAIIGALYDVISGPAGQARDWNRFRSLFVPGGLLMPTGGRPNGGRGLRLMSVNDFVATSGSGMTEIGFREREIARGEEQYGSIAHVFSTYESYRGAETSPYARGINSIQLLNDGSRWWILTVYWQGESQAVPLPAKYLPGGGAP